MQSYENEMNLNKDLGKTRLKIPILQYFWQSSPLAKARKNSIHQFLRDIHVFDQFSDVELWQFSKFLHLRKFSPGEFIFKEGDRGFGFYLILGGNIEILSHRNEEIIPVVGLQKHDYFGELSLLEANNIRNASALAKDEVLLLAIFLPDTEELIEKYPVVAAKLLQAISFIVAKRFNSVVGELNLLKDRIERMEMENNERENSQTK